MNFLQAAKEDAGEIFSIMNLTQSLLTDKGWYCIDSREYVEEHIKDSGKGIVFKAVEHGRIAGFLLIHYPGPGEDSLGDYIKLGETERLKTAYMDSLAVLPAFRGQGLQRRLMEHGEACLSATPYCHLMGTVHPENKYSLNNFLKLGYRIAATAKPYGSLPRYIMYRSLILKTQYTLPFSH